MKKITLSLFSLLFINALYSQVSYIEEFSTNNAKKAWYTDSWATSITTVNSETYFTYVDSTLHAVVGKISSGVIERISLDSSHTVTDDGHNEFCLALDKDGYIHVIGNMHCDTFRYWRSNTPYSVLSGFKKITGAISGTFSYPHFRKSKAGDLFLSARVGARKNWWGIGGRGVGLFRYNTASKKWDVRGALSPDGEFPVIFWENSGVTNTGYQMFKSDIRFDNNDRIHFSTTVNVNNVQNTCNYAVYACSDDYGSTWKRSNGTSISLPMNKSNTDVIDGYENANMGEHSRLLVDETNRPAVVYSIDGKTWYRYVSGTAWQPRVELVSNAQWGRLETLFDAQGTLTVVSGTTICRFKGYNASVSKMSMTPSVYRWDFEALSKENTYRGIEWNSGSGSWKIVKIKFDGVSVHHQNSTPDHSLFMVQQNRRIRINNYARNVTEVEILSLNGKKILRTSLHADMELNLSDCARGIYLLRANMHSGSKIFRILLK